MANKDGWRLAEALVKGGTSLLPLGSFLIEYYNLGKEKIMSERFEDWKNLVDVRAAEMQSRIDELSSNDFFFSCFQITTTNALKAHQKEKMEMFTAALFNSLEFQNLTEDKKLFFLTLLDKYTVSTVKLLAFFSKKRNSKNAAQKKGFVTSTFVNGTEHPFNHMCQYFPGFEQERSYLESVSNQLAADGLLYQINWSMPGSPERVRDKKTTNMGDEFLAFIEAGDLE